MLSSRGVAAGPSLIIHSVERRNYTTVKVELRSYLDGGPLPQRLYPGRKFTPDGHPVGSIGEVTLPPSHPSHDAKHAHGMLVQIKLTAGKNVSMYAECDRLIVLRMSDAAQTSCGRGLIHASPSPHTSS